MFSLLVASVPSKQLSKRLFQLGCINISCFSSGIVCFFGVYRQAIRLPTAWEFLQLCPLNSWLDLLYSTPPPRTWWGRWCGFQRSKPKRRLRLDKRAFVIYLPPNSSCWLAESYVDNHLDQYAFSPLWLCIKCLPPTHRRSKHNNNNILAPLCVLFIETPQ